MSRRERWLAAHECRLCEYELNRQIHHLAKPVLAQLAQERLGTCPPEDDWTAFCRWQERYRDLAREIAVAVMEEAGCDTGGGCILCNM